MPPRACRSASAAMRNCGRENCLKIRFTPERACSGSELPSETIELAHAGEFARSLPRTRVSVEAAKLASAVAVLSVLRALAGEELQVKCLKPALVWRELPFRTLQANGNPVRNAISFDEFPPFFWDSRRRESATFTGLRGSPTKMQQRPPINKLRRSQLQVELLEASET